MNRSLPLILTLDQHGVPHRWVTWQQAVWYYAKERVAWELGRQAFTAVASKLRRAGLDSIRAEHYEGGHWLGSFAVYLVSGRGLPR